MFGNALPCYQDGNVKANSLSILSGEGCGCVRRLDCHSWWGWGDATGVYKAQDGPPRQRIIQPKSVVSRWGSSLLRALRASTHVILATILQANVSSCAPFTDGKRRVGDIPRTVQGHSRTCWSQDTNSGMCDVGRPYLRPWDRPPLCRCAPPPKPGRCVYTWSICTEEILEGHTPILLVLISRVGQEDERLDFSLYSDMIGTKQ